MDLIRHIKLKGDDMFENGGINGVSGIGEGIGIIDILVMLVMLAMLAILIYILFTFLKRKYNIEEKKKITLFLKKIYSIEEKYIKIIVEAFLKNGFNISIYRAYIKNTENIKNIENIENIKIKKNDLLLYNKIYNFEKVICIIKKNKEDLHSKYDNYLLLKHYITKITENNKI